MDSIIYNKIPSNLRKRLSFLITGDSYWVARWNAPELVDWLISEGFIVLGFEGFRVVRDGYEPNMDCIVDLSNNSSKDVVIDGLNFALNQAVDFIEVVVKS